MWLEPDNDVPMLFDILWVANHSLTVALTVGATVFAFVLIYAFSKLPKERQKPFMLSWLPIAIGIGMLLAVGVPVKSDGPCGIKHSVVALPLAPLYWSDPTQGSKFRTYDLDDAEFMECD